MIHQLSGLLILRMLAPCLVIVVRVRSRSQSSMGSDICEIGSSVYEWDFLYLVMHLTPYVEYRLSLHFDQNTLKAYGVWCHGGVTSYILIAVNMLHKKGLRPSGGNSWKICYAIPKSEHRQWLRLTHFPPKGWRPHKNSSFLCNI